MPSEKTLKRIVIILGVLLVGGFMALVSIIIYRAVNLETKDKAGAQGPVLALPSSVQPVGISEEKSVIILKVRNADGVNEELVFDALTGDYLGKLIRED